MVTIKPLDSMTVGLISTAAAVLRKTRPGNGERRPGNGVTRLENGETEDQGPVWTQRTALGTARRQSQSSSMPR